MMQVISLLDNRSAISSLSAVEGKGLERLEDKVLCPGRVFSAPVMPKSEALSTGGTHGGVKRSGWWDRWVGQAPRFLVATATLVGLTLGISQAAVAFTLSATWLEAMNLTSSLEGYNSALRGFEQADGRLLRAGETLAWDVTFGENFAALNATGTLDGDPLVLDYIGVLSGVPDVTDLTWNGNLIGSLGGDFFSASDMGTFVFTGDGYTPYNFQQFGTLGVNPWAIASSSVLSAETTNGTQVGWSSSGTGGGIGDGVTAGIATSGVSVLAIDSDGTVTFNSSPSSTGTKSCSNEACNSNGWTKRNVPEPMTVMGSVLAAGAISLKKLKKKRLKVSNP